MSASTVCPTCRRETNTDHISYHAKTINGTLNEITTWRCSECDIFFVERVEKISTVYLLSPVTTALSSPEIPTEDEVRQDIEENTYICSECDLLYSKEDWCFEYGTCKRCAEHLDFKDLKEMVEGDEGKATHPDPEQYYCQECGCIYSGARECPVCDGDA